MREFVFRWGNRLFEGCVLCAIVWATLTLGGVLGWGIAVSFGFLAAAVCLWTGMRLLAGEKPRERRLPIPAGPGSLPLAARLHANRQAREMGHGRQRRPLPEAEPNALSWAPPLNVRSPLACILIGALAAYLLVQLLPVPVSLVSTLSPPRVEQERLLRQALQQPPAAALTLSIDPNISRRSLALVGAVVMAFAAGAYLATGRPRARRTIGVLVVLALFEAAYGLAEALTGHQHVFWIPVQGDFARGTFYNRNHFAATLSLFLPVAIGWFFSRAAAAKARHDRTHPISASPWDLLSGRQALWLLVPAVLVAGIIQSYSRGGFASMILGTALMFAIGTRQRTARAVAWLAIPLALALFAYGINSDFQTVVGRFETWAEQGIPGRTTVWTDSLRIFRDYPLFGVGLGNFPTIYMQYASVGTMRYPFQAHNEWLEGLVTLGALGMGLALLMLAGFFVQSFRRIRAEGDDRPWLLGIWCGLIGLAMHSFGEFNLHIPSISITAALLAGILLGFKPPERSRRT